VNAFLQQFSANIKFDYICFDRVIIRGYIRGLFFEAGIVLFLRAMGFCRLTNGVMRIFTDQLNAHVSKKARQNNIPILWWPSVSGGTNGAKLRYVEKRFAEQYKGKDNEVFCILTDKEPVRTFVSRELTSQAGKKFHRLYKCRKPVKQYYIYFHDQVLGGPCYLKISSYLPFHSEFYFNGHNAVRLEVDKRGLAYTKKDNAFISVDDPVVLQEIANTITGSVVKQRIDFWMNHFFRFDKGKYSTRSKHLKHEWYMTQVEVCSNIIFKSARLCTNLFERILDKFSRFGLPDSIAQVFDKRPYRSSSKNIWRLYDNNACMKTWFRGNSIKQHNKTGSFIRTETTVNNPKSLGLKKPICYLQAYLWYGLGCNNRFLDCCADVDVSSISDGEEDIFTHPVSDHNGNNIAPPDLRKDRQVVLCKELLKPKYLVYGFRTAELARLLPDHFRNSAQIRYEIRKLIVRGLIKKKKYKSFYTVTQNGWKWLWASISSTVFLKNPIISKGFKNSVHQNATQPSKIEEAYTLIDHGLTTITRELALAA
jgi:hypothetical protein